MRATGVLAVLLLVGVAPACTAILGEFSSGSGGADGGTSDSGGGDTATTDGPAGDAPHDSSGTDGPQESGGPVTISPTTAAIGILRAQAFTATGGPVTWSVMEGATGGGVSATGTYIAPPTVGTYHVVATSNANPTQTATATVTVGPVGLNTVAGQIAGFGTIDGPPAKAHFRGVGGLGYLTNLNNGTLLMADSAANTIRKYSSTASAVTTLAGTPGVTGIMDGTGAAAQFNYPTTIAVDDNGNKVWILDENNYCIRSLDPTTGAVTTFAGTCGTSGETDGATGATTLLGSINSMILGPYSKYLYVCQIDNTMRGVRKIDVTTGQTTWLFTGLNNTCTLAPDDWTNGCTSSNLPCDIYLGDNRGSLRKFSEPATGGVPVNPTLTTVLASGVPDNGGFASAGMMTGFGNEDDYYGAYFNLIYDFRLQNGSFNTVPWLGVSGSMQILDGMTSDGTSPSAALARSITAMIDLPSFGNVWFADSNVVREVQTGGSGGQGTVTTPIGTPFNDRPVDGMRNAARFTGPFGVAVDSTGAIYVADVVIGQGLPNDTIRRIAPSTFAVSTFSGAPTASGPMVAADGPATQAIFGIPVDLVVIGNNLYVGDAEGEAVRQVSLTDGSVTTIAGQLNMSGSSNGTGTQAHFSFLSSAPGSSIGGGLATDGTDLYVADAGNFAIRKVTVATHQVTTVAGGTQGSGNGTGVAAQFQAPTGLAYDNGTLYIADEGDDTIRAMTVSTGAVTTLIGLSGQIGDMDGDRTTATFTHPFRISADHLGNLYVVDLPFDSTGGGTIRRIDIAARTVSIFAGTPNEFGFSPGPLPATLNCPTGMTFTSVGDMLIGDPCDGVVGAVQPL